MDPITNIDLLRHAAPRHHPAPALRRPTPRAPRPSVLAALRAVLARIAQRPVSVD